jgi:hypothetical protein
MCVFLRLDHAWFFTSNFQYDKDVGRATGAGEVHEDFISNLSRISQLTGNYLFGECPDMLITATNRVLGSHIC